MARTRGAKSSSPSSRKRVHERSPFQNPSLSLRSRRNFSSGKARVVEASGETLSHQVRGSATAKESKVENLEPIDLTEQSLEPSPVPSPVPISGCHLRRRQQSLKSLNHHFSSPKFHLK
ncbi:hypothetical protein CK203_034323 [Vitis vinifera]|uniref:Uncharacterized protein n=1 Tax=Vitis vinifera TaxID=29760 RepID=A0A438INH1_VITVI|nr:hypothetical protein CK203_034323 [Vitis vinifera]